MSRISAVLAYYDPESGQNVGGAQVLEGLLYLAAFWVVVFVVGALWGKISGHTHSWQSALGGNHLWCAACGALVQKSEADGRPSP